jgi:hypothetical protein
MVADKDVSLNASMLCPPVEQVSKTQRQQLVQDQSKSKSSGIQTAMFDRGADLHFVVSYFCKKAEHIMPNCITLRHYVSSVQILVKVKVNVKPSWLLR